MGPVKAKKSFPTPSLADKIKAANNTPLADDQPRREKVPKTVDRRHLIRNYIKLYCKEEVLYNLMMDSITEARKLNEDIIKKINTNKTKSLNIPNRALDKPTNEVASSPKEALAQGKGKGVGKKSKTVFSSEAQGQDPVIPPNGQSLADKINSNTTPGNKTDQFISSEIVDNFEVGASRDCDILNSKNDSVHDIVNSGDNSKIELQEFSEIKTDMLKQTELNTSGGGSNCDSCEFGESRHVEESVLDTKATANVVNNTKTLTHLDANVENLGINDKSERAESRQLAPNNECKGTQSVGKCVLSYSATKRNLVARYKPPPTEDKSGDDLADARITYSSSSSPTILPRSETGDSSTPSTNDLASLTPDTDDNKLTTRPQRGKCGLDSNLKSEQRPTSLPNGLKTTIRKGETLQYPRLTENYFSDTSTDKRNEKGLPRLRGQNEVARKSRNREIEDIRNGRIRIMTLVYGQSRNAHLNRQLQKFGNLGENKKRLKVKPETENESTSEGKKITQTGTDLNENFLYDRQGVLPKPDLFQEYPKTLEWFMKPGLVDELDERYTFQEKKQTKSRAYRMIQRQHHHQNTHVTLSKSEEPKPLKLTKPVHVRFQ